MLDLKMTMSEAIHYSAGERPNLEVLICGDTRLTNRELIARIDTLSSNLCHLGVRKGDKIATLLPPGPEFVYLFFACAWLGAVIIPLNPEISNRSFQDVLEDANPQELITIHPIPGELTQQAIGLRHIIPVSRPDAELTLEKLLEPGDHTCTPEPVEPGNLLVLLYTSGTTGKPKATMHTHRSLIAAVVATLKVRELWTRPSNLRVAVDVAKAMARYRMRLMRSIGRPQTFLSTVGWNTITGLEIMLQGLLMGDRLVIMPRFHPQQALELIQQEKVTILVAVPTAYSAILALPDMDRYDTSSLLVCGTGTAPCPPALGYQIQQRFKCALYIGFGMTEAAGGIAVSSMSDSDALQAETVGRPLPGVDIRIVDDQRRDLPVGQVGELAVRSDGVMQGYFQAPELTAEVIDKDGWYYTGDLVTMDEKGYLRVVGRKKDMIIRGGQNIYPAEIEGYLVTHPKIQEVAVVGVPSPVGGESVWAFIRSAEGVDLTAIEVLNYCRGTLEPFKIPSQVRFLKQFPLAETGKPRKFELRAMAIKEMEEAHHDRA